MGAMAQIQPQHHKPFCFCLRANKSGLDVEGWQCGCFLFLRLVWKAVPLGSHWGPAPFMDRYRK